MKEIIMKATAKAPANIAFVKYWGKSNNVLTLPNNASISMNLSDLFTVTTIEFSKTYTQDLVEIGFFGQDIKEVQGQHKQRVCVQLDRLRKLAGVKTFARVRSLNNFPADVGIASSASAFAALTAAACQALALSTTKRKLSILTRLGGSGSATRSIHDGFTEWKKGNSSETSFALQLAPPKHWDLVDVVLVVSTQAKKSSSLEGHEVARTSPYYSARLKELPSRLSRIRTAIQKKDFTVLGEEMEKDTVSLHCMAMTSNPSIWYWEPETIAIIKEVQELRRNAIEAYFTIDAGPNVHIICKRINARKIEQHFKKKHYVRKVFVSGVGNGVRILKKHLF